MKTRMIQTVLKTTLVCALAVVTQSALAQGTATGPFTSHIVDPGPVVNIGDASNPIPIDLDPFGPPWTKSITDPNFQVPMPGPLVMIETIQNVGTEDWLDWHEHILPPPAGVTPAFWLNVINLSINGSPITFNTMGIGTSDLWLDTFSQPVQPGDILIIEKEVMVFPDPTGFAGLLRLEEYPTPEPASLVLLGLGGLTLLSRGRKSH